MSKAKTVEGGWLPLFPTWEQEQRGYDPTTERLRDMWAVYGKADEGVICGTCAHCVKFDHGAKTYYKCDLNKITHGAGTDWRLKWPGCGKHELRQA